MKNKIFQCGKSRFFLDTRSKALAVGIGVLFFFDAAGQRAIGGQVATCTINVGTEMDTKNIKNGKETSKVQRIKRYKPKLNQIGYFDQVSDVRPMETIPIQVNYPHGRQGDKILISVMDGGKLDNGKKVKLSQLNNQKQVSFNFQVSSEAGMYRVTLRKDNDMKVVQLWVRPARPSVQN